MGSQCVPAGGTWHYQGPVWLSGIWPGKARVLLTPLGAQDRPTQATHQPQVPTVPKPWLVASCDLELLPHWLNQGQ